MTGGREEGGREGGEKKQLLGTNENVLMFHTHTRQHTHHKHTQTHTTHTHANHCVAKCVCVCVCVCVCACVCVCVCVLAYSIDDVLITQCNVEQLLESIATENF